MTEKPQTVYEDSTVVLDGAVMRNTLVRGCLVVYSGGIPPMLTNVNFENCRWHFDGSALRTLEFLRQLVQSDGMRPFVMAELLKVPGYLSPPDQMH